MNALNNEPGDHGSLEEKKSSDDQLLIYSMVFENVLDAIIIADLDFKISGWNQAAVNLYKWTKDEAIGNTVPDLLKTRYMDTNRDEVQKKFLKKGIWEGIVFHLTGDNEAIPVSTRVSLLKDSHGKPVGVVSVNRDISEELKTRDALEKSEFKYQKLFSSLLDGFAIHEIICDESGNPVDYRFLEINPAFEKLTGLKANKVIGKTVLDVFPDTEKYWIDIYGRVALTGEPHRFSNYSHEIGKHFLVYAFSNQPGQFAAIFTDITDLKETELKLAQSEERYKAIVEDQVELISRFKKDGTPIYANPALCRFYGLSYEEVMSNNIFDNIHEDDRQGARDNLEKLTPLNPTNVYQNRMTPRNGVVREMRWSNRAIFDENGDVLEYQSGGVDITDQRRAEEALQESERLLLTIADNYPNSYLSIIEKDLRVGFSSGKEFVNQKLDPADFYGLSLEEVFREHAPYVRQQYEKVFRGEEITFELFFNDQHQLYTVVPLYDSHDEISRILSVVENITDRKRNEEELEEHRTHLANLVETRTIELEAEVEKHRNTVKALQSARDAAESANRAKSAFLANMSHELRTPMNAILGYTQLMKRQTDLDELNESRLNTIIKSGEHLLGLINEVLALSKIEAGKISVVESDFQLSDMLEDLKNMFFLRAEEKGLDFQLHVNRGVADTIRSDAIKMRQILVNLLGNAIKFTENGLVSLSVDMRKATGTKGLLKFIIEDTGIGINPEDRGKIFEPFVQTGHSVEYPEGTGLGLPITRHYVQLLDGELDFVSEPGKGSQFSFIIPVEIVSENASTTHEEISGKIVIGLESGQPRFRILIVEDEIANRELLFEGLETLKDEQGNDGFELKQAENGKIAKEIFETWKPDLIFMDMRMPVMDGFDAIQSIRSQPGGKDVIIISLSASAFDEERLQILDSGCDAFLPKPYHENDLMKVLEKYLKVRFVYVQTPVKSHLEEDPGGYSADQIQILDQIDMMTAEWLEELRAAAITFDVARIRAKADEIEYLAPDLSNFIRSHVDKYEYRAILNLLP